MKIAVNTRFLIKDALEGFGHYTLEIMSRIVRDHPEDEFLFYFDRPFEKTFLYSDRVTGVEVFPPARHPLLFYVWNAFALKRQLRNAKPDVFFSPDSFMPLGLDCPSVITVHDVAHRPYPDAIAFAQRKYYDYFMPRFLKSASHVITVSEFSKQEILKYYSIPEKHISVVYNGIGDQYVPLDEEVQHAIRMQFTDGKPYFLFVGAIHPRKNVARLIQAYSLFRQQTDSNLQLLIAGRKSWDFAEVDQALETSAYRKDIRFTGYVPVESLAKITASAFALCYISLYEGFGLPVVEAMACGVPVIVSTDSAQSEIAGEAGLPTDPLSIPDIAEAMTKISSDPTLRKQMIDSGHKRSRRFSWDVAARDTYNILQNATR